MYIYAVHAKGLQPYYTDGRIDALNIYFKAKCAGLRCSMRRVRWDKALAKLGMLRRCA